MVPIDLEEKKLKKKLEELERRYNESLFKESEIPLPKEQEISLSQEPEILPPEELEPLPSEVSETLSYEEPEILPPEEPEPLPPKKPETLKKIPTEIFKHQKSSDFRGLKIPEQIFKHQKFVEKPLEIKEKVIKQTDNKKEQMNFRPPLKTNELSGKINPIEIKKTAEKISKLRKEVSKVLVGQGEIVDGLIMGLLCNSHVLVEGVPGIAKTLAIRALAAASGCSVKRIQFTVDMLPTDIIGITSYSPEKGFEIIKGPIFANFLIADEINRAPPKCVFGDTPVIMENGEIADIKEIIKKCNGKKTYKKNNEYWIIPKKKLNLLAFDFSDYKIKPEEVKYLYKQKTSEPFFEVELKSGRKIKTSKIHPFFTLEKGEIKTIQANELKEGGCVLIPRRLPISGDNNLAYNKFFLKKSEKIAREIEKRKNLYAKVFGLRKRGFYFEEIKRKLNIINKKDENLIKTFLISKPKYLNYKKEYFFSESKQFGQVHGIKKPEFVTEELAKFMAILIAEGSVNKSYFYLTMKEKEIPNLFIRLIKKLFDLDVNLLYDKKRKQYRVAFRSDALIDLLKALCYNPNLKAGKKYIPQFILKSKDDIVREFLKVYYDCDGSVSRDCLKITTKSKEIANQLSYLLLRMGFVARISRELSNTIIGEYSYKRKFYHLRLYGGELNEFYKKINFLTERNRKKLKDLIKNLDKKQTDLIPGMHQIIRELRKERGLSHKQFYDLTGMNAHNLENPKNSLMHSRHRLHKISKIFPNSSISKIVNGDFYCDFVKKNREIKPKKEYWLYDFSMKNKPSFIAGFGGIISHNTQSALIEGMQEKQVTIGKETFPLPNPFFVMATENPIENAGVYPLPEAQIDRFLFKLTMGYPESEEEKEIMSSNITIQKFEQFDLKPVVNPAEIIRMQELVKKVYLDDNVKNYILSIVRKTREKDFENAQYVSYGCSPRASIGLFIASKANALMNERDYVLPEDVQKIVFDVMRHRLILSYKASIQKINPDLIIKEILNSVSIE